MSLLDTLGSLLGNSPEGGGQQALIAAALEFVNSQPGGIMGLIQRFQQHGAGDVVPSWIGTGENKPISPDALTTCSARTTSARSRKKPASRAINSPACWRRCCRISSIARRPMAKCRPKAS